MTRLDPTDFGYQNFYEATLTSDIAADTLTIPLDTVPSPVSGVLVINPDSDTREVIVYTSKGASSVTCPADGRGYSGSTAGAHLQGTTVIMAPVDVWFESIASGELSTDPLRTELFFDYVASGCVWSGDSYGASRNGSMTSGIVYIDGRRLVAAAVVAHTFTASKDTYIDASDNGDGTVLLTYNEVNNNAASPALASNSIRLGIVVTDATDIQDAGSVNQGEDTKVLPIASSVPYQVTDSLGNLICPRDPQRRTLGKRAIVANLIGLGATSATQITGLSVPVKIPTGRKVRVNVYIPWLTGSTTLNPNIYIYDGAVGGGTQMTMGAQGNISGSTVFPLHLSTGGVNPSAGSHTFNVGYLVNTGTITVNANASYPAYIEVELI